MACCSFPNCAARLRRLLESVLSVHFATWRCVRVGVVTMVSRKKGSNPTDAYRKEQRKKELNKNKANRKKTREHILLNKDTRELEAHLRKAKESDKFNDSTGDRSGQHKAKQLETK